jgi:hypothetical protein
MGTWEESNAKPQNTGCPVFYDVVSTGSAVKS